jgi:hypothetical protein
MIWASRAADSSIIDAGKHCQLQIADRRLNLRGREAIDIVNMILIRNREYGIPICLPEFPDRSLQFAV